MAADETAAVGEPPTFAGERPFPSGDTLPLTDRDLPLPDAGEPPPPPRVPHLLGGTPLPRPHRRPVGVCPPGVPSVRAGLLVLVHFHWRGGVAPLLGAGLPRRGRRR